MLQVECTHVADMLILHVGGDLDLATAPRFRQGVVAALQDPGGPQPARLVVDLVACDHLDSIGLGLLLGVLKRAQAVGATMVVVCPPGPARRVLDAVSLDRVIPVVDGLAEVSELPGRTAAEGVG